LLLADVVVGLNPSATRWIWRAFLNQPNADPISFAKTALHPFRVYVDVRFGTLQTANPQVGFTGASSASLAR
jgi:hypothetical protein